VYPRLFQLGNVAIPTSGIFTAIAILSALFLSRATARRLSLDHERIWDTGIAAVLTTLIAPRLVLIFTNWADFRAHPAWMLGLVSVRSPLAIAVGLALAVAVMLAFLRFAGLPLRQTLDAFAPGIALGFGIYWVGAYLAGSDFGAPSTLPWAVTYTSRLASLWSHTPLGTPLHPVQLYFALIALGLFGLSLWMVRTGDESGIRDGEAMGAFLFVYGFCSFFLNFLRGDLASAVIPLPQMAAVLMVLTGGILWLIPVPRSGDAQSQQHPSDS
jgi:phosphatidylglycerol:prolipoprotein diacylglycerol transferase